MLIPPLNRSELPECPVQELARFKEAEHLLCWYSSKKHKEMLFVHIGSIPEASIERFLYLYETIRKRCERFTGKQTERSWLF